MKKSILFFSTAAFLLVSCSESMNEIGQQQQKSREVRFTSSVEGMTKASGTQWTANDMIGIYMLKSGTTLESSNISDGADNVAFKTTKGDGYFVTAGQTLNYPENGSNVDFISYYPYNENIEGYIYKVDVTDQSDIEKIDLMYSDNLKDRNAESPTGHLQFKHELSFLTLNISTTDGAEISSVSVKVNNTIPYADYNLKDRSVSLTGNVTPFKMNAKTIASGVTAQAVIVPQDITDDLSLTIQVNNKEKTISIPERKSFISGERYVYSIKISNLDEIIPEADDYAKWSETPVITEDQINDNNLQYITHYMSNGMKDPVSKENLRNYSMLYDKTLKFAYWVAYPLFNDCVGNSGRTDAWDFDPAISESYQANLASGFNESGYDRGHQIPSGDRTCDKATNRTTFYYTNMTPQKGQKMNQAIWADLENKVRAWMSGTDTVFVVTGAMPPKSNISYTSKGMAIPEYYFKALVRKVGGTYRSIAFKLENKDYSHRDYMQCKMSVADLEKETGFIFFPKLNIDKTTVDSSWN